MASVFAKIKFFLSSFLVLYVAYLATYKCAQLKETQLEHAISSTFHPISHTHNQACEVLDQGSDFLKPYVAKAHEFLDTHVHSHPLFKQYKVEDKLSQLKAFHYTYVHPYIIQLFQFFEVLEVKVYDQVVELIDQGKKLLSK